MSSSEGSGTSRTQPAPEPRLLPGDNPQAYIPGDRRRALARGEGLPDVCDGAALFVDISGFTPLTEALAKELGGRRGAEELTATLDRVFAALLERLHLWRGSVVYFSGDAVTAWIDGDDGLRATACALEMQEVMDRVGTLTTPGGTEVVLSVKVAVAVGRAFRFVVGDPSRRPASGGRRGRRTPSPCGSWRLQRAARSTWAASRSWSRSPDGSP